MIPSAWRKILIGVSAVLGCLGFAFSALPAQATTQGIPYRINFQGRLTDSSGNILADGYYNMKFRIADDATLSGGHILWTEDREVVAGPTDLRVHVVNGLFSVQLGEVTALSPSIFNSSSLRYLEVELPSTGTNTCSSVGCASWTEGAFSPRHIIGASPYTFVADTLDGLDSTDFAQITAANTFTGANLFAPTTSSTVALTVKATTAGSTNSLEVFNSSGVRQAYFDAGGALNIGQTLQATSNNAIDLGTSGTAFRTGYFGTSVVSPALNATTGGGTISTNAGSLQRIAAGTFSIDLKDSSNTTLAVTNSGTGVANFTVDGNITASGLTTDGAVYVTSGVLNSEANLAVSRGGTGAGTTQAAIDALSQLTTTGDLEYYNGTHTTRLARGSNGQCLTSNTTTITWGACSSGSTDLQGAYNTGSTISTGGNDIAFTLNSSQKFTTTTAAGATGYTSFALADGSNATPPAQLVLITNNDTNEPVAAGLKVTSAGGGITTALDASGSNITNALAIGANAISGTNFSVTGGGAVTAVGINSGSGLIQGTGGLTISGTTGITGAVTHTLSATSGTGTTLAVTDSASSGATTVKGLAVNLTGTDNATGSNTLTGLDFGVPAAHTNNTYTGINFGTGFTNDLTYNGSTVLINGSGQIAGGQLQSNSVANGALANSSLTVTAGNGLSGGGSVSLGSSTSLAVAYGSASNTAVQGNVTLVCPSGSGNLTGTGNTITLGSGGTCNALDTVAAPSFATSVTTPLLKTADSSSADTAAVTLQSGTETGNTHTSGAVTIQSGNASGGTNSSSGNVSLDAGSKSGSGTTGTVTIAGANASALTLGRTGITTSLPGSTLQHAAAGTLTMDLLDSGADTTLSVTNSDVTRKANLTVENNATVGGSLTVTGLSTGGAVYVSGGILNSEANLSITHGGTGSGTSQGAINNLSQLTTGGDLEYYNGSNTTRLARGSNGDCLTSNTTTIAWAACNSLTTLQNAYANGATISTSGSDIGFTLNSGNSFTVGTAAGGTGFTTFSLADGSNATPPAQLVLVKNNDTDQAVATGVSVQSAAGAITTAFDASGSNITNALAIGAHAITGTNFSVTGGGAVTAVGVNSGTGLIQGSGGVSVTGTNTLTYNSTSGTGTTLSTQNTGTSGTNTIKAEAVTLSSTATSGTNNLTGIDFSAVTSPSGTHNYYALNFGTGFTDLLRYNNSTTLISGNGQINGAQLQNSTVGNASLANSSITINGTGISGGGSVSLGGSLTLSTAYGSGSNTAVQGNTTLTCPSGSGNLTGGGTSITLGTGGSCASIDTIANPSFSGLVTVSKSGANALAVTGTPLAGASGATSSLIQIGPNAIASGNNTATTGGTWVGLNAASTGGGSTADFINFQNNGSSKFKVDSAGGAALAGGLTIGSGAIGAFSTAGLLQNAAFDSTVAYSNLTKIGTITTGTWNASTVDVAHGGTGATTLTANGVLYGNGTGAVAATTAGTTGQCLVATTGAAPSWGSCGGTTLQNAYDNDTSGTADIITSSSTKTFLFKAGPTFDSASLFQVQDANSDTLLTVDSESSTDPLKVIIGSAASDSTQILLQLDSFSTFADTAGCTTTSNQGALYYNTTSNAIRSCVNGAWEDLLTTGGLGLIAFGVVPDSPNAGSVGDIAGIAGNDKSPCKVYWSAAQQVTVAPCVAYSGGRKVIVSSTNISTAGLTANQYANVCLTGTNGAPQLGAGSTTEASASVPAWNANNPVLCLATVKGASNPNAGNVANIYDVRTFTTTQKTFGTLNATAALGVAVVQNTSTDNFLALPGGAAAANVRGVVVGFSGSASSNTANIIIATAGPQWVKATGTSARNGWVEVTNTSGYTQTTTTAFTTTYADLGVASRTISTTCTAITDCQYSQLLNPMGLR